MSQTAAPRIFCITATDAPVVAVFRRGPSNWTHVGKWDLAVPHYEPGAWVGGRVFARRSDLSPDGRYLCYFAHKPSATWEHGESYVAVSRLPWLTALKAFPTCGTWTRGFHFVPGDRGERDAIDLPIAFGLRSTRAIQFATERRRGWEEAPDSPPRDPNDAWDQRRNARLSKPQPGGGAVLCVESVGWAGGEFTRQAIDGLHVRYSIESGQELEILDDLQWADWDAQGRLLVATRAGRLQIRRLRDARVDIEFDADLSALEPAPSAAPQWAQHW